jgi:hypothetical protein
VAEEGKRKGTTNRRADGTQLPIQDPDHSILSRMKYQVVEFIVPMHNPRAHLALVGEMGSIPRDEGVKVRDGTDGLVGVDVDCGGLGSGDSREGLELAGEVGFWGAEGGEAQCGGREGG